MNRDLKNAGARIGGYHYEVNVCILGIIDLLADKVEKIFIEKAEKSEDVFDDMKIYNCNTIHHFQVKWAMKQQTKIKLSNFLNPSSNLCLIELFNFWESIQNSSNINNVLHVFTSKDIEKTDLITQYIKKINNKESLFSYDLEVFQFNIALWDEPKFKNINNLLTNRSISKEKFLEFLNSLMLEFNQPTFIIDTYKENEHSNSIKKLILKKISEELGLDKAPNNRSSEDWYNTFLRVCYECIINRKEITKEYLIQITHIITDLSPIKQEFLFDKINYIKTKSALNELTNHYSTLSHGVILVIGAPGSGKSYLLTYWSKLFEQTEIKPIIYYCFIKDLFDEEYRISKNQLIQNLIFDILKYYPLENTSTYPLLAATQERLEELLKKLGKYAKKMKITIPIIIDGLDHIIRVLNDRHDPIFDNKNLLNFFMELKIPDGIIMIIGTQPDQYIEKLKTTYDIKKIVEICGFSDDESLKYFSKYKITANSIGPELIHDAIEKIAGNPLLHSYSVQANKELTVNKRKNFFKQFISKLPITAGDVNKYYDILWKSCSQDLNSKRYAQILSLIDFHASDQFLDEIVSPTERHFVDKKEHLSIIDPVLQKFSDGIIFFHDSFSTYVRTHNDFKPDAKIYYNKKLFEYFMKIGIHANEISFSECIKFAFNSNQFDKILQIVNLEYIDQAFLKFMPIEKIITNIDFAIDASIKKYDMPNLICYCILKKYTKERIEYNLPLTKSAEILINFKENDVLLRLIYPNKTLNLDVDQSMSLTALALNHKIDLPYQEIIKQIFRVRNFQNNDRRISNIDDYAIIVTHAYGLKEIMGFIEYNLNLNNFIPDSVYENIGKYCKPMELKILKKYNMNLKTSIIIYNCLRLNNYDIKKYILEIITKNSRVPKYFLNIAIQLNLDPKLLINHIIPFKPKLPKDFIHDEEIEILRNIENHSRLLTYCKKQDELDILFRYIHQAPKTSVRLLRELMFKISSIKTNIQINNIVENYARDLLDSFSEFVNHNTLSGIHPNDFKSDHLNNIAKYILSETISTYLELQPDPNLNKLIQLIQKLDHKFHWQTNMGFDNIFISTDHMLECFNKLFEKYPNNIKMQKQIIDIIKSSKLPDYTVDRVERLLDITKIYQKFNMMDYAKETFKTAIITTHAYGYRKDLLLDELHTLSICLNSVKSGNAEKRASQILELTEYLWGITDHKETRYIPGFILEELLRINSSAANILIQQFQKNDYKIMLEQGYKYIINNYTESSTLDRLHLIKILENNFDSDSQYFSSRLKLIDQSISLNDNKSAIEVLEDTRNELDNAMYVKEKQANEFNDLADKLNKKQIDVSNKIQKDESRNDIQKIILNDGTVDQICKQFKNLDIYKQRYAEDSINILLKQKIPKLKISDLKKLELFCLEYLKHAQSSPIILLHEIAKRYKKIDSKKYIELTLKAFEQEYGWVGYMTIDRVDWLIELYNFDDSAFIQIFQHFAKFNRSEYGTSGSIKRLGKLLTNINDVEMLSNTYFKMYDLCKTFFRTYEKTGLDYTWLKERKFNKMDRDLIIKKILDDECIF